MAKAVRQVTTLEQLKNIHTLELDANAELLCLNIRAQIVHKPPIDGNQSEQIKFSAHVNKNTK